MPPPPLPKAMLPRCSLDARVPWPQPPPLTRLLCPHPPPLRSPPPLPHPPPLLSPTQPLPPLSPLGTLPQRALAPAGTRAQATTAVAAAVAGAPRPMPSPSSSSITCMASKQTSHEAPHPPSTNPLITAPQLPHLLYLLPPLPPYSNTRFHSANRSRMRSQPPPAPPTRPARAPLANIPRACPPWDPRCQRSHTHCDGASSVQTTASAAVRLSAPACKSAAIQYGTACLGSTSRACWATASSKMRT
mmetsp:Transcript_23333/g.64479  ORF Transcript_23333/g.64479 Transcript_23333/m.64479 type:complete len:246 (-) Transcript_23333:514-1251(-)